MAKPPFEVKPLSGTIGAELNGIDLSQPMSDATFAAFSKIWRKYKVLFFRDQELTPEQHIALGKRFGEIDKSAFIPTLQDYPDIRLQDMSTSGAIPGDVDWHHDNSFVQVPQKCSFLYAIEVPEEGGRTLGATQFASAWAAASDSIPARIAFLIVSGVMPFSSLYAC